MTRHTIWSNFKFTEKLQNLCSSTIPPHPVFPIINTFPCTFDKTKKPALMFTINYNPDFMWISPFFHCSVPGSSLGYHSTISCHISAVSSGLTVFHEVLDSLEEYWQGIVENISHSELVWFFWWSDWEKGKLERILGEKCLFIIYLEFILYGFAQIHITLVFAP